MKFQELLESTECEVVISVCGGNRPTFEVVKPEGELPCEWTLHVNPDGKDAEDHDFGTLDEIGAAMLEMLWGRSW